MELIKVFLRTLQIGYRETLLVCLMTLASLVIAVAQILEPMLFGSVVDALSKAESFSRFLIFWVGLGLVNATFSIYLSIVSDRYAHRQRLRAKELAFERTIALPYYYHSLHGSGKIIRTIQTGADQVFYITLSFFRENLIAAGNVLILLPMAFTINFKLASVIFVVAGIYGVCNWFVIRRTHQRQNMVELKHQELTARLVDVMANVGIVRSFTRVAAEMGLFRELCQSVLTAQYPVLTWWGVLNVITRLSSMAAMVTIVAIGSIMVRDGSASHGQIVTFVGFSTLLIARLEQLSAFVNRIVAQLATAQNLFSLFDYVDPEQLLQGKFSRLPVRGRVVYDDVSFQYGGLTGSKQGVFHLNFVIEPGQTVALVGPTGAGKTTILSLLQRLYFPQSGRILIDDHDIKDLAVENLSRMIATVFQEPGLFNRSIFENIAVGRSGATPQEVETAARLAFAHDFIVERPQGYDFVVGERGLALSGGERQRIAIARAILKDAPLLLLDEATSALDNVTERKVQAAMDRLSAGKTTFVIAHRLSTIREADRILVVADGKIVQSGSYPELKNQPGLFAHLLQAGQNPTDLLIHGNT